jgi:DNA processing protein
VTEIIEISRRDELYPSLLKEITKPPEVLYVRGDPMILNHPLLVAVVGSRKASSYGQQVIKKVFTPIAQLGVPLVSGLAYGIDCLAHKICVDNKAPTIAVLGSGINDSSIYPSCNLNLAHQIISSGGAVISEYPINTPPRQHHFPERNRIVAGLSKTTVIIQAAIKSGSLITARLALESNRDVAAVPGPITDPLSEGTNQLIQQGATPILNSQDITDLLGIDTTINETQKLQFDLTKKQRAVFATLSSSPLHVDQIKNTTNIPTPVLSVTLTELEHLNVAQHVGGMKYIKKS